MDLGLNGKNALVCGASKGIGRAIARELAIEGCNVMIVSRSEDSIVSAAESINSELGTGVKPFACDLAAESGRSLLKDAVSSELGRVDILVHNTGGPAPSSVQETSMDSWRGGWEKLFEMVADLNASFLPGMIEQNWGRIIAVTSLSVMEPIPNLSISNAVRSAVTAMLKTLADEVARYDITVNCVAPGAIKTDRLDELMEARLKKTGQSKEEYLKSYLGAIPAGRLGTPEEFAGVAAFLCSERASYITGSTISIDGGKRRSVY